MTDPDDPSPSSIIASVGHELRSPLTSIRGYTSLLLNRWDRIADEDKLLMLDQIHHDAERVTRLINELLDMSRIQGGELTLAPRHLDLAVLSADVVERLRMAFPSLEVVLDFPAAGLTAEVDADKIEQVLTNLLENAAKYGDPEGITVRGRRADGAVTVSVSDRGPGVAEADREQIFERGFQHAGGHPSGTGLGLWISRNLVEAHGGSLDIVPGTGPGAEFRIRLPDRPVEAS